MNIETFSPLLFPLSGGFFAAWVFYGLTPFSKPSGYERTVQALIFTIIVEVLSFFAEKIPFSKRLNPINCRLMCCAAQLSAWSPDPARKTTCRTNGCVKSG